MKMIKYSLFGLVLTLSSFLYASDNDGFTKIDDMHLRKWQTLVSEAQLTPKEIDVVQPVFMEYEKAVWNLHKQNREFFRSALKDGKKVKPNYAELNDRYVDFEFQEAQLFKNYHLKLRKLLQPETLFKYYHAEREFKRKLLRDFHDHRPPDGQKPQ
jgi:hypothetical protein